MSEKTLRVYLFVYNSTLGTREQVKQALERLPEVKFWRTDLPSSFYILSEETSGALTDLIRKELGEPGLFIITEVDGIANDHYSGWLPMKSWHLIQNKTSDDPVNER